MSSQLISINNLRSQSPILSERESLLSQKRHSAELFGPAEHLGGGYRARLYPRGNMRLSNEMIELKLSASVCRETAPNLPISESAHIIVYLA